jgi:hypothetical protein
MCDPKLVTVREKVDVRSGGKVGREKRRKFKIHESSKVVG